MFFYLYKISKCNCSLLTIQTSMLLFYAFPLLKTFSHMCTFLSIVIYIKSHFFCNFNFAISSPQMHAFRSIDFLWDGYNILLSLLLGSLLSVCAAVRGAGCCAVCCSEQLPRKIPQCHIT
jgi:hypothetical protein